MSKHSISHTAAFIAIKFYGLTRIGAFRKPFDEQVIHFYENVVQSLPSPLCYYHYWLDFKFVRSFYIKMENFFLPGDLPHILARKWYMQKQISKLLEEDYEQLLILGSGFDHLGWFFTQTGIQCIEIDIESVISEKKIFFEQHFPNSDHPHLCTGNITHNAETVFDKCGEIDPDKKTIIVAEGFFDYITINAASSIIKGVRSYFSHKPVLISTYFSLKELSFFYRWVYDISIKIAGEKLLLNTPFSTFKDYLYKMNFDLQVFDSQQISKKLKELTKSSMKVMDGFYLFTAS